MRVLTEEVLINLEHLALRVIGKRFPSTEDTKCIIRGGHFLLLKAAAISLWKTQRLPLEIVDQVLLAIEPTSCYHRLLACCQCTEDTCVSDTHAGSCMLFSHPLRNHLHLKT